MGNLTFSESGWDDYLYWQTEDKKTLKRINQLLQDILRNGYDAVSYTHLTLPTILRV